MRKLMEVVDNSVEARKDKIITNFRDEIEDLLYDYAEGARTLGTDEEANSIIRQLERELRQLTFKRSSGDAFKKYKG